MSFNFLNPWFLLGALAVAVPVWLHLRRKTETNVVRFSALRFLDDTPQPRHSPLRLRELVLLALRILAVLLLAGAFAWPYLRGTEQVVVRESRVYILDNTLSRQAGDGWVQDGRSLADDIRQAGLDVQVAVIELTSQPRVLAGFADDRAEVCRKLADLTPSFQRGPFLAAFRQAHALLASSLGERKRIIFCTDSQENQWTENLNAPAFLPDVPVELRKPAGTNAPNVALSEPRLQRIFLGDKSLVNFTVRLSHSGAGGTANVRLEANGQTVFNRGVVLTNHPETVLLQGQWEADPAQWLKTMAAVEAAPDALAGDNRAFVSLPPVREGKVALLAHSPYLRLALSPDVMRGHWETRLLEPSALATESQAGREAEVLIVESSFLPSAEARKLVHHYLSNGRGVLLLVNRVSPIVAAVLHDLGFEMASAVSAEAPRRVPFRYLFSNHPVFHPFVSPDFDNLFEVTVGAPARIKPVEAIPLVFSETGDAVFFQGTKFPGRLFVAAFGLEREQTSWPTHITFIPFLDLCLQNSRPEDTTPLDYEPGALSVWSAPADAPSPEVVLRDERGELSHTAVVQGKAQVRLPDRPGLYTLSWLGATERDKVLSVNPSPKESELCYLDSPEALELWQLDGREKTSEPVSPLPPTLSLASILRQQIWWWLLVGGLVALLVETFWTSMKARTT